MPLRAMASSINPGQDRVFAGGDEPADDVTGVHVDDHVAAGSRRP